MMKVTKRTVIECYRVTAAASTRRKADKLQYRPRSIMIFEKTTSRVQSLTRRPSRAPGCRTTAFSRHRWRCGNRLQPMMEFCELDAAGATHPRERQNGKSVDVIASARQH